VTLIDGGRAMWLEDLPRDALVAPSVIEMPDDVDLPLEEEEVEEEPAPKKPGAKTKGAPGAPAKPAPAPKPAATPAEKPKTGVNQKP
jgi:hypothetical protein